MNTKLSVGDKVYRCIYEEITEVITIERVTKTQALAKNDFYKFKIYLYSGSVIRIGADTKFSNLNYKLETPELKERLLRQKAIYNLSIIDFKLLSTETLQELLSIVEKTKTKN